LSVLATHIERDAIPARGPRFFREDEEVMFEFVIDGTNRIGPRLAMKDDSLKHPEAWAEFAAGEAAPEPEAPEQPARTAVTRTDADFAAFAGLLEPAPETSVRDGAAKIERATRRRKQEQG
jgi:hypothetical protein